MCFDSSCAVRDVIVSDGIGFRCIKVYSDSCAAVQNIMRDIVQFYGVQADAVMIARTYFVVSDIVESRESSG